MWFRAITILLFLLPGYHDAQISGIVVDEQDQPLTGAHVWFSGTSFGMLTDTSGAFVLDVPPGRYTLIVSFLGYAAWSEDLLLTHQPVTRTVELQPVQVRLDEVTVQANASRKRKRWLKSFEDGFFGYTEHAKDCRLINPEVLLFEESGTELRAVATDLLQIENHALGYRILFLLESTSMAGSAISYHGKPLFFELQPEDEKQAQRWKVARAEAYHGSLRHFLRSLGENALRREGFEIYHSLPQGSVVQDLGPARVSRIVRQDPSKPDVLQLSFEGMLKVVYLKEKDRIMLSRKNALGNIAGSLGHRSERSILQNDMKEMSRADDDGQVTYLFLKKVPVLFDTNGNVLDAQYLEEHGYLGYERIADLLPLSYLPDQ
ncbi:MAG: carboxypeptidase-like regulatory domain-containing protein [Saprospiraceae bacterium]|nr:carboxypeptidase-like regulatory domain-containing protein [Saprospiraceae bacterium]